MFFCPELLLPQFGGKFSVAWIADVRGIAYVKKKDALKVDIPQLCDDITEMLDFRGKRPEECLSLMIACRLVHGVLVLFDNRITILLDNVVKFSFKCRIPEPRSSINSKEQGDVLSRKRKRKDKSDNRGTNEHVRVDRAAQDDGSANLVPLHSITLNELPLEAMTGVRDFQSEVQNFGDLGFSAHPDPMPFDDVAFPLVEEVESSNKRAPSDVLTTPTKKRAVEKPMSQFDAIEKSLSQVEDPEMQIPRSPFKIAEKPVTPLPRVEEPVAPPQEPQPNRANSIDLVNQRHIKAGSKKKKGKNLGVPYCMNENWNKCIDRRLIEVKKPVLRVPEFTLFRKHVSVDIPNIIALFLDEEPHIDDHIYRKLQSLSQVESLLGQRLASRHTTLQPADLPSVVEAPHEQSHQFLLPVEEHAPLFANFNISGVEGKESEVEDPPERAHRFTVPVEVHAPHFPETNISALDGREQFQPLAESSAIPLSAQMEYVVSAVEPIVHEKSPFEINLPQNEDMRKLMRRQRHKYIRHTVKTWDYEKNGKLTIEDVCPKPLNRFNIAATFGDLLTMSKHDYVVLNTNENTLELESIEIGPKLLE